MADETKRPILSVRAAAGAKRGAKPVAVADDNLSSIAAEAVTPDEGANIREVRLRIEEVFNALGTESFPGTVFPVGAKNNAAEAGEYVLAKTLKELADERLKNATEAAEKTGVFGDPASYVNGQTVLVFSDPNFTISVKKGKPGKMINREAVEDAAVEFLGKRADEFLSACMKPRAPTTQIIVSMK